MCFKFDAWCCFGAAQDHDDDCYYGSPAKGSVTPHHHAVPLPAAAHHHYWQPAIADAEGRTSKTSNDDAIRGGNDGYCAAGAAYVYSGPQASAVKVKPAAARNATVVVAHDHESLNSNAAMAQTCCIPPATATTASIANLQ